MTVSSTRVDDNVPDEVVGGVRRKERTESPMGVERKILW